MAVALVGGLAGLTAAPAGAAGLALRATTPTTGLQPGATVTVRISGAAARQVVRYGVCADTVRCAPAQTVTADAAGAATVRLTVTGMATLLDGTRVVEKACRPDRCHVVAHPQGQPAAIRSLPLRLAGERVSAAITPTTGLVDGQVVRVTGRVRGAEGRTVRAVQACATTGCAATLAEARVAADGTFALTGWVRRTLPGGTSCSPTGAAAGPCHVAVSVVGDPSFGIASALVRFTAPGLAATVTPRSDLVDRSVVQVRATQAALAGRTVRVRQVACDTTDPFAPVCAAGPAVTTVLDAKGRLATALTLRRIVGAEDCARNRYPVPDCSVEVTVLKAGAADPGVEATRAIVFFRPLA